MSDDIGDVQDRSFARATKATAGSYPPERRLTASQLAGYLDRRAFAVIGSARPDGRPHAAMSAYTRRGIAFWLPTVAGSVRERNVRAHPWLTMTVTEGDRDEHVAVLIEGPAEIVPLDDVAPDIRATVGDWAEAWLRLDAARVLSYASEEAAQGLLQPRYSCRECAARADSNHMLAISVLLIGKVISGSTEGFSGGNERRCVSCGHRGQAPGGRQGLAGRQGGWQRSRSRR